MILRPQIRRREGATTVEFSVIAIILFMVLFGIFEYGRFLFMYHLTMNAARDACRFATVKTGGGTMKSDGRWILADEPAAITATDVQNVWRTGTFNGTNYGMGMLGLEHNITGWQCNVFGLSETDFTSVPPNLNPTGKPAWNSTSFQQKICVQITGTYQPVVPALLGMSNSIQFTVNVVMSSEAN